MVKLEMVCGAVEAQDERRVERAKLKAAISELSKLLSLIAFYMAVYGYQKSLKSEAQGTE